MITKWWFEYSFEGRASEVLLSWLMQVLELLEKCLNLKHHFKGSWNSLKMIIFPWKLIKLLGVCECLLFSLFTATNKTKNSLKKSLKESLKKIVQENSWYAKKMYRFCYFRLPVIHICSVNISWELLENFYFSPWKDLQNSLDLHFIVLHKPCTLPLAFYFNDLHVRE